MTLDYKNVVVAFHIGRGGRFHNGGHYTFMEGIERLEDCFDGNDMSQIYEDGEYRSAEGIDLQIDSWDGEHPLTGRIERDGIYDTDTVLTLADNLNGAMDDALYRAIRDGWCGIPVGIHGDPRFDTIKKYLEEQGYEFKEDDEEDEE